MQDRMPSCKTRSPATVLLLLLAASTQLHAFGSPPRAKLVTSSNLAPTSLSKTVVSDESWNTATGASPDNASRGSGSCTDNDVEDLGAMSSRGTCEGSRMNPFDDETNARKRFEHRIDTIVKGKLAAELDGFVREISGKVLQSLTDELLTFTMQGQQFLCLNIVCLLLSSTVIAIVNKLDWRKMVKG